MANMEKQILTTFQKQILDSIDKNKYIVDNFFFTGGTALSSCYFQHRFSEDLDFFAEEEFDQLRILAWIKSASPLLKIKEIEQQVLNGQLTLFLHQLGSQQSLKLDFAYFPFSHLGKFNFMNNLRVSSLEDIAVNKVQAVTTRSRSRDYLDLMLCLKKLKWSNEEIGRKYRSKFEIKLPPESLATAYTNVQGATDLPIFLGETNWSEVEEYFLSKASELKDQIVK